MINPDMEIRLVSAFQVDQESDQIKKSVVQKMLEDYQSGFAFQVEVDPDLLIDTSIVYTRLGTDLFEIRTDIHKFIKTTPDESSLDFFQISINRRKAIKPGSGSGILDSWELHLSNYTPLIQTFESNAFRNPGNHVENLSEQEFFEKFLASAVDPVATRESFEKMASEIAHFPGHQIGWISEAGSESSQPA